MPTKKRSGVGLVPGFLRLGRGALLAVRDFRFDLFEAFDLRVEGSFFNDVKAEHFSRILEHAM